MKLLSPLLTGLALTLVACQAKPVPEAPYAHAIAASGDLVSSVETCSTIGLHPRACVVAPAIGRSTARVKSVADRYVTRLLEERGYRVVPAEQADCWMAYAVGVSGEAHDFETLEVFGVDPSKQHHPDTTEFAILMAVVDPTDGDPMWRASARGAVGEPHHDPKVLEDRVRRAFRELLATLPQR